MASAGTSSEGRGRRAAGRARVAVALLALLAVLLVGTVLAMRARHHEGTGPVHFGQLDVLVQSDDATSDFRVGSAGKPVVRTYHVENVGVENQYVRVRLEVLDSAGNVVDEGRVSARIVLAAGSRWCERTGTEADGWYYYQGILAPKAETEALPVSVALAQEATASESYQLVVRAQAVQSKNQAGQNAGHDETIDVLDVQGWPEGE